MISNEFYENVMNCEVFIEYIENFHKSLDFEINRKQQLTYEHLSQRIDDEIQKHPVSDLRAKYKKFDELEYSVYQVMILCLQHPRIKEKYEALYIENHIHKMIKQQDQALEKCCLNFRMLNQFSCVIYDNQVDLECPFEFKCIDGNVNGWKIPNQMPYECECLVNCTSDFSRCCASRSDFSYKQIQNGQKALKTTLIYECNDSCNCNRNCPNRLTQKRNDTAFTIFKTKNRGWSLKSGTDIAKGIEVIY
jgi:hypothetical protein